MILNAVGERFPGVRWSDQDLIQNIRWKDGTKFLDVSVKNIYCMLIDSRKYMVGLIITGIHIGRIQNGRKA